MRYFAYGSNISTNRMIDRGIKYSNREFTILNGYKLVFNKKASKGDYSFANIEISNTDHVEGYIYEISDSDILVLDKFEGYPNHYNRIYLKEINAIVYIANDNKVVEGLKPQKEYLDLILEGEFSKEYHKKLQSFFPIH